MKTLRHKVFSLFVEILGFITLLTFIKRISRILLSDLFGAESFLAGFSYFLTSALFLLLLAYSVRRVFGGWTWRDLGFKLHRSWRKDIWFGFVVFALIHIALMPIYLAVVFPKGAEQLQTQMGGMLEMPVLQLMVLTTLGASVWGFLTGGFTEEVMYRGYFQGLFTREVASSTGLLLALMPFVLGHYFNHPEWHFLQIFYTLPSGFAFAVTYYATGSLLIPIAAHTFINWFPFYAKVLYARGHTCEAYALMLILGICYLLVCYLGRRELKALALKTKELFSESGLRKTILGFFLGLIYLALMWGRNYLEKNSGPLVYLSVLGMFSLLCLGYSFRNRKRRTKRQ